MSISAETSVFYWPVQAAEQAVSSRGFGREIPETLATAPTGAYTGVLEGALNLFPPLLLGTGCVELLCNDRACGRFEAAR